eukprot:765235-Rhodomonas_salina.3
MERSVRCALCAGHPAALLFGAPLLQGTRRARPPSCHSPPLLRGESHWQKSMLLRRISARA